MFLIYYISNLYLTDLNWSKFFFIFHKIFIFKKVIQFVLIIYYICTCYKILNKFRQNDKNITNFSNEIF